MRWGGGGVGHMLLQYDQNCLLKDDTNHDDEEDHGCDDDHQFTNVHAVDGDDCNEDEPFNLNDQPEGSMERDIYWESQEALLQLKKVQNLQEILEQCRLSGSKLREELSRLIELARKAKFCECFGPNLDGCSKCLRRGVVNLLSTKGFNASLCTSMWKKTHSIPGGKHEYIDVIASTQGKKRKIRFLIEIEFRDEFKMAKACDEYGKLIDQLPETYIGKPEHLNAIVRVVCDAAKRSTAEKKIHLGPWRKRSFMQMKWSATSSSQLGLKQREPDKDKSNLPIPPAITAVRVA